MPKNAAPKGLPALFQPIDLTEGPCWKTILRFSFPIILSYLLQQVYSISDAAIVGQTLSGEQVAGVNDIAPIARNIFLQFAFGVSAGFCVITSCNVGSHNQTQEFAARLPHTDCAVRRFKAFADSAGAGAFKSDARRGSTSTPDSGAVLYGGLYLLRHYLCRYRRAAFFL